MPRTRRALTRARRAIVAVAACAALGAASLAAAGPAAAARDLEVSLMDDQLLLGASQTQIDGAMQVARALGVDRIRVSAFWSHHAPRATSTRRPRFDAANHYDPAYNWSNLDPVVQSAARHGLRVLVSISTPGPYWASASPRKRNSVWKLKPDEVAAFAGAVAARYAPVADQFAILNEPNQGAWLQPQSDRSGLVAPHLYRDIVHAAYPAIKRAAPQATVLVGELAPSGRDDRGATRPIRPLEFLRVMGCRDARFRAIRSGRCRGFEAVPADAIGHHPYALFSSPRSRSRKRDDAAIGDGRRLLATLDKLVARRAIAPSGGRRLDVHYTEFGYQTDPPDPFAGIPLSRQDRWLQEAAYVAWRTPRVRGLNQFRLTDGEIDHSRGATGFREFQSGILFRDNSPKPAFYSFPNPFVASSQRPRRGSKVLFWGQVRPGGRAEVTIERRPGRSGSFRRVTTLRTNANGYFSKRLTARSGQWRYRWTSEGVGNGRSATLAIKPR